MDAPKMQARDTTMTRRWDRTVSMGIAAISVLQPLTQTRKEHAMKKVMASATIVSVAFFAALAPMADAQTGCPAEVTKAKEMLAKKNVARGQEIQAPRSLAGARQEIQAPRGQEVQAPRGQEVQAPRGQEMQAPRGQEVQAPRGQDTQAPRSVAGGNQPAGSSMSKASTLVQEAEAACKAGDMKTAKAKAEAAISALK